MSTATAPNSSTHERETVTQMAGAGEDRDPGNDPENIATTSSDYSAVYFHSYNGPPYTYEEPHWQRFFGAIAASVIATPCAS